MKNKTFLRVFSAIMCLALVSTSFSACSSKKEEETTKATTEPVVQTKSLEWAIEPTLNAGAILPFVRADFNSNTNHYDISYDEYFKIQVNGQYGIVDLLGKVVLPAEYEDIFAIRNSDDYIGIKKVDGETTQKYIHSGTFETETAYSSYNKTTYEYYWNADSEKAVFVENTAGETTRLSLDTTSPETVKGVRVSNDEYDDTGLYGLYSNGDNITGLMYSDAGYFTDGVAAFKLNGKWGYVDSSGKFVTGFAYQAIDGYSAFGDKETPYESFEGYITVRKGSKYGILTNDGDIVADFIYEGATPVVDGKAFACQDGRWGVVLVGSYTGASGTASSDEITNDSSKSDTTTTTKSTTSTTTTSTTKTTTTTEAEDESTGSYKMKAAVNLRSGAGTSNSILDVMPEGAVVRVDEVENGWGHTSYNGSDGWFSLQYAEKE